MLSNLLETPPEILRHILVAIGSEGLKNFSLCSKSCRDLAVEVKVRNIFLTQESLAAFQDGGSHANLRHLVRHVTFVGLKCNSYEEFQTLRFQFTVISRSRIYTSCLEIFPRVCSLQIEYSIDERLANNLGIAVFSKLSTLPFWNQTLKSLYIGLDDYHGAVTRYTDGGSLQTYRDFYKALPNDDQEFMGATQIHTQDIEGVEIPYPAGLEEAIIYIPWLPIRLPSPQATLFPWHYHFISSSIASLKRVKISTRRVFANIGSLELTSPGAQVRRHLSQYLGCGEFIGVKQLSLHVAGVGSTYERSFEALLRWFPNLEEFVLDLGFVAGRYEAHYKDGGLPYAELLETRNLKRISVPWPMMGQKRFSRPELADLIHRWEARGLNSLREVEFVRTELYQLSVLGSSECSRPYGFIRRGCKIVRSGSGPGLRLWWRNSVSETIPQRRQLSTRPGACFYGWNDYIKEEDGIESEDEESRESAILENHDADRELADA
ncbi:hypothetical protein TWF730_001967 [Orbilia blumenaviensis]|uniref:F-box domain-containing protein n=1 Tax=Orbilia blumenaviensis TaxID=1796055 RepID=A0AAV9UD13_9PEZI